ncbi:MAG: hypothetical protein WKG00_05490 [Polyangiaceae bacterium]
MRIDPWKACTVMLGGVFCLVVASGGVDSAAAQNKAPQKIPSGSAPAPAPEPGKGPVKIVGTPPPEDPGATEGGEGDNKKSTPAERATKLMEAARAKVIKLKADPEGRRERALKHIEKAISETRAIPAAKE